MSGAADRHFEIFKQLRQQGGAAITEGEMKRIPGGGPSGSPAPMDRPAPAPAPMKEGPSLRKQKLMVDALRRPAGRLQDPIIGVRG